MKNLYALCILLITASTCLKAQVNFNLELLDTFNYPNINKNDVWGYVDESGGEYAIMGLQNGISIISLDGEDAPSEVLKINGPVPNTKWRDIKDYKNHLYITCGEGNAGLFIVDMSSIAKDSLEYHYWAPDLSLNGDHLGTLKYCHNLFVDDRGYVYLAGCNIYSGGVLIFDINDNPDTPMLVGAAERTYAHDCFVRNDILFTSDIYTGHLSIYNIEDRSSPQLINREMTSGKYTHNAWSSADNRYVFTTDETVGGYLDAYYIADLQNIRRVDSWQPENAFQKYIIPHNTHFLNNFLITSWYTEGVIVLDASQPDNLIPVAQYDTYTATESGYEGGWGAYPFLPSGRILVSDKYKGLHIFKPNLIRPARIEGLITNFINGEKIADVKISIIDTFSTNTFSSGNGFYKTGTADLGQHLVSFSKEGFRTIYDTINFAENVKLVKDIQLRSGQNLFNWNLLIRDSLTGENLEDFTVQLTAEDGTAYEYKTDESGQLKQALIPDGFYKVHIKKWGYHPKVIERFLISGDLSSTYYMVKGYRDFFNVDHLWETDQTAESGFWERDTPKISSWGSIIANPGHDSDDKGEQAYITGNNDYGVSNTDDVDNGQVDLRSPWMDLGSYSNTKVSFQYWLSIFGRQPYDDTLIVKIESPQSDTIIAKLHEPAIEWRKFEFLLSDHWKGDLDSIRILFSVSDSYEHAHIVEAGIDAFQVLGDIAQNTSLTDRKLIVYPNPAVDYLYLSGENSESIRGHTITIYNIHGQKAHSTEYTGSPIWVGGLPVGLYFIEVNTKNNKWQSKFIIRGI